MLTNFAIYMGDLVFLATDTQPSRIPPVFAPHMLGTCTRRAKKTMELYFSLFTHTTAWVPSILSGQRNYVNPLGCTFRAQDNAKRYSMKLTQCSQRSGAPVGPDGGTAKSPGPDGTAKCGPHPSWKPQDGRLCGGRQALQCKTF